MSTVQLSHPPVEVSAREFRDAASKLPGARRPRGSVVPRDTRLMPGEGGIMVETPVMSSLVPASRTWRMVVSVDARRLLQVCESFKKIEALKSPDDRFAISVENGQLKVKFRTTAVSIPLL